MLKELLWFKANLKNLKNLKNPKKEFTKIISKKQIFDTANKIYNKISGRTPKD